MFPRQQYEQTCCGRPRSQVRTICSETASVLTKWPARLLVGRLLREQNHVDPRRYDFRLGIRTSLNQAIMAQRDLRKRRCRRSFEQSVQLRMKPFAARSREGAELVKRAHFSILLGCLQHWLRYRHRLLHSWRGPTIVDRTARFSRTACDVADNQEIVACVRISIKNEFKGRRAKPEFSFAARHHIRALDGGGVRNDLAALAIPFTEQEDLCFSKSAPRWSRQPKAKNTTPLTGR